MNPTSSHHAEVLEAKAQLIERYKLYYAWPRRHSDEAICRYLDSDLNNLANEINGLGVFLQKHDPDFPKTWEPL